MQTMFIILHVVVCVFLTLVVLLQPGAKQGMGAAFGGGSSTVFGGRGATTFLQKLTAAAAMLFMVTSLSLSYMSSRTGSAMDADPTIMPAPSDKKDEAKTDAPKTEQTKGEAAKGEAAKTDEAKPADVKPEAAKPADVKPEAAQPADVKPEAAKPQEPKPAEPTK